MLLHSPRLFALQVRAKPEQRGPIRPQPRRELILPHCSDQLEREIPVRLRGGQAGDGGDGGLVGGDAAVNHVIEYAKTIV